MVMRLRLFLLVALILGTAAGIDIEVLLKDCRNGQHRWTAGVTGLRICKLVTRLFDWRRIWKKGWSGVRTRRRIPIMGENIGDM